MLTLEVFQDDMSNTIDLSCAETALELLAPHVPEIDLSKSSRKLRIPSFDYGTSIPRMDSIRWPRFSANLNVFLTTRQVSPDDPRVKGLAHPAIYPQKGIAVVNTSHPDPELTFAHELGHLLHLRDHSNSNDTEHCSDNTCIMHETFEITYSDELVAQKGVKLWLEKRGRRLPEYKEVEARQQRQFCQSCSSQLAKKAFFLSQSYSGNHLASHWLQS
jgi:hypothetical protein